MCIYIYAELIGAIEPFKEYEDTEDRMSSIYNCCAAEGIIILTLSSEFTNI